MSRISHFLPWGSHVRQAVLNDLNLELLWRIDGNLCCGVLSSPTSCIADGLGNYLLFAAQQTGLMHRVTSYETHLYNAWGQ